MNPTRPQLAGTFGMIASTHWLASAAGMAVLEGGGNAFDAAVANVGKPSWILFEMDYLVFVYFAAACVVSALLFGLVPGLHASRVDLNSTLKEGSRDSGSRRGGKVSGALVILQFMLAVVLLGGALVSLHSWALTQIDVLHRKVRHDQQALEEASTDAAKREARRRLGNRGCDYCGGELAPLVCNQCDSLQWSDLSRRHLADGTDPQPLHPKLRSRFFGVAAFICHHRFKLLASVWSLIAVVFIPLAFQVAYERALSSANERAAQTDRAREVINAVSEFRASLDQFVVACGNRTETLDAGCHELLEGFKKHFLFVSWNAAPVVDYFQRTECSRVATLAPAEVLAAVEAERRSDVDLSRLACTVAELHDPVDYLDSTYRGFVRQVLFREEAGPAVLGPNPKEQQKREEEEAALLWRAGLQLGCLTFGLAHGSRFADYPREKLHAFGSCVEPLYGMGTELEFLRRGKAAEPESFRCRPMPAKRFNGDYWYSRGLRWAAETDRSEDLTERRLACNASYPDLEPEGIQQAAKDL